MIRRSLTLLAVLASGLGLAPRARAQTSFTNSTSITVTDNTATPATSGISVSGMTGAVNTLTVRLNGLTSPFVEDLDLLLVAPGGQKFILMSDVGGSSSASNVTLTLGDAAGNQLPLAGGVTTGTWRPTNGGITPDAFAAPAPVGPYNSPAPFGTATFASVFAAVAPNGTWTLYAVDDLAGGGNSTIAGGWTITIATLTPSTTVIASSLNPSFTSAPDNSVQFTATVTSGGSPVTSGTVTFRDGATIIGGPTALNGSGQATLTTSALTEGSHAIQATFNGTATLTTSTASLTQVVNNRTVVTLPTFCNPGAIALPDGPTGSSVPYPSNIYVSGFGGSISGFTVSLKGLGEAQPGDLDLLLVGPAGQKYVLMSDVGGTSAVSGVNLILSDAAASLLPTGSGLVTGTFKPTAVNSGGTITFPAPAPAGPYTFAAPFGTATLASVFNGASPNGTWSLYVVDDLAGGGAGNFAGGWCLNFSPAMVGVDDDALPDAAAALLRASPDPMRTRTTLRYALARAGEARLELFDSGGRRVRTLAAGPAAAGWHEASWDGRDAEGRDVGAGVYFARLHVAGAWSVQRIVRLK